MSIERDTLMLYDAAGGRRVADKTHEYKCAIMVRQTKVDTHACKLAPLSRHE